MQIRQRHFGRRHEIQIPVAGDLEQIGLELRQVARSGQTRRCSPGTAARPRGSRARAYAGRA